MPRLNEPQLSLGAVECAEHAVDAVARIAEQCAHTPRMEPIYDEVSHRLRHLVLPVWVWRNFSTLERSRPSGKRAGMPGQQRAQGVVPAIVSGQTVTLGPVTGV